MDIKIEIKEEPVWLEDTACSSFEDVQPESPVACLEEETKPELTELGPSQPATDVEETTIEEHTPDQLVTRIKQENSVESPPVLTGGPLDTGDGGCEVLKTGSEPAGDVSNQSKGEPIRHHICATPLSAKRHPRTHLLIDSTGQPKNCTKCGKVFLIKDIFKIRQTKKWADCCDECCRMLCMKRPHSCNECGKNFNYKSGLAQHLVTHSGERLHCCHNCGRTFTSRSNLNKHMLIHSADRQPYCHKCDKTFSSRSNLTNHLLIHSGDRQHYCRKCGKTFVCKEVLTRHYLTHSGPRVHCCKQCGKTFCLKGVLTQHLLTHSAERPHCCSKCGMTFRFKSNLTRHLLTHSMKCHTVV